MRLRISAFAIAASMLLAPMVAWAECPIRSLQLDDVEAAVTAARTCRQALNLMNECRRNSGGDVGVAMIVIDKCEATFVSGASASRMAAYRKERAACRQRYARESGTMGASFQATCEASVAAKYAR